ncbi:DUF11 domain-containing protein [filamentous cyanobacterium LEGE 11480]|uniref:DUF11 domain-containing protein n=1 Tax=Romeriopsis navalis LEGE 11480 TaxID=2777977 RepID=A0A928VIB8_9CYAN|nr:hypothetical protein [Romeriopsis navalis]MBE9028860.1 DUF11 domain-containing protein [Romeriopsis navalis LEGE 11480]
MKRISKRLSIGVLAAAAVTVLPFVSQPVMASLQQAGETISQALQRPQVKLNLSAEKQVVQSDNTAWQALQGDVTVVPGDVLRYTVTGENAGQVAANKLVVTQPIPQKMTYRLDTATDTANANKRYSIDGGKTFTAQPMVEVTLPNGKTEMRPAPATAYTHVRWQFQNHLNPDAAMTASYEVTVR